MTWDWHVQIVSPFDASAHDPSSDKACHQRDSDSVRIALEKLGSAQADNVAHETICAACLYSMNKHYSTTFCIPTLQRGEGRWISHSYLNPISNQPFCVQNFMRSGEYRIAEVQCMLEKVKSVPPPPAYLEAACDAIRETRNILEWVHEKLLLHPGSRAEVTFYR